MLWYQPGDHELILWKICFWNIYLKIKQTQIFLSSRLSVLINNSKMWKQSFGAIDIFPLREETDWLVLEDNKACSDPREMKDSVASKVVEDPMDYRWGLLHCSFKRDPLKRQSNTSHLAVSIPRVVSQGMPGLPGEKGESGHVGLMVRGRHYFHSLDSSHLSQ